MTKQDNSQSDEKKPKKTYTMQDLRNATKEILKEDSIAKKLPEEALVKLSMLLAKTAMKGDL